jgi:hypothetical protein
MALAFVDGFGEALASRVFFGVGLGSGFGVAFGFGVGLPVGFGAGVDAGVGFGVGADNSISLFAVVTSRFSSSGSSFFSGSAAAGEVTSKAFGVVAGDAPLWACSAVTSCALPNQTMLS